MATTPITPNHSKSVGCVASVTGVCIAKNDRLIAKAPEMLAFIRRLSQSVCGNVHPVRSWINDARALLREIEGE